VDDALDMAAQVSFYFALSLFPFLIVLAALLGWFRHTPNFHSFWQWLTIYLPPNAQRTVMTIMSNLSQGFEGFLSFGLLLTLWSASSGFQSLMDALSHVYGGKETRSYLHRRFLSIVATVLAALFLLVAFGLLSASQFVAVFAGHYSFYYAIGWKIARWAITLVFLLLGVDLVNYFFPAKHPPWRLIMPGSVLAVTCFILATVSLRVYVAYNHNMSQVYGALTGFIVLMLWMYLLTLSLLLGAQTDAVLLELRPAQNSRLPCGR
jgi:membrane protein